MSAVRHREVQTRAVGLEALKLHEHPSQYTRCRIDVIDLYIDGVVVEFIQHRCHSHSANPI
jgi:hypothetical protein